MERPLWRADAHSAPITCMPAKKMVPSVTHKKAGKQHQITATAGPTNGAAPTNEGKRLTHKKAGNQPQMTATAGPTIGAAPATEVKWWPHNTHLLLGT